MEDAQRLFGRVSTAVQKIVKGNTKPREIVSAHQQPHIAPLTARSTLTTVRSLTGCLSVHAHSLDGRSVRCHLCSSSCPAAMRLRPPLSTLPSCLQPHRSLPLHPRSAPHRSPVQLRALSAVYQQTPPYQTSLPTWSRPSAYCTETAEKGHRFTKSQTPNKQKSQQTGAQTEAQQWTRAEWRYWPPRPLTG